MAHSPLFEGGSGMCEAPLIERFDCEKVIVIEDSGQQGKTDLAKVNGVRETSKQSEGIELSEDITEHETKENNGIIEKVNFTQGCNGKINNIRGSVDETVKDEDIENKASDGDNKC